MGKEEYVIGVDFGTDSVRAVVVDALTGENMATSVCSYSRWKKGLYCDASKNQFRQHPLDYIDGLTTVIKACVHQVKEDVKKYIKALSVATTGSSPVAVDEQGCPLALLDDFKVHPNAMFFLWKDHSAVEEAEEINKADKGLAGDYLKYVGGRYSSEWYWAKLLHLLRTDKEVGRNTYTFVEQSDWIPYLLTGGHDAEKIKRNVCAAGHKALWTADFGGLPPLSFFKTIDPVLEKYVPRFGKKVYSADELAGNLSEEWAGKLGLSTRVKVGIGSIDAHVGAVGGGIKPYFMSKVIGTSTCDMMVVSKKEFKNKVVDGISGQVADSIIPGMVGLEAGQSAFGDIYSWFRNLLLWPLTQKMLKDTVSISEEAFSNLKENILEELNQQAAELPLQEEAEFALDWFNGRRTPFVDPTVKGMIGHLTLGSHPPQVYRALVESTCMGSRAIIESIAKQGVEIHGVNALGGIAVKSKYVIQTLADVLNRPIHVSEVEQPVAIGAAMFAAVVSGCHESVEEAYNKMGEGGERFFSPNKERIEFYNRRFIQYKRYGEYQH